MPHHVRRMNALGRLHVVRAAGRVNVMIARPPAELRRIDPALDLKARRLIRTTILAAAPPVDSATVSCCVFVIDSGPRENSTV